MTFLYSSKTWFIQRHLEGQVWFIQQAACCVCKCVCARERDKLCMNACMSMCVCVCVCVCVCGPPGLSELQCGCCITGSRGELKDPGGRQRHFLLYLPAYWLAWQPCLTSPWATLATCVQGKSDQHPPLRGTSMVTRHQRLGLVFTHHRGQSERSRSMIGYCFYVPVYTQHTEGIFKWFYVLYINDNDGLKIPVLKRLISLGKTDKLWEQLFLTLR